MNLIALTDENFGIGKDGEQIIYIPEDLRYFKSVTKNKTVLLGRKTLLTFPNKKPLPNRENIVLSHDKNLKIEGAEVINSIEEAIKIMPSDSFIIGGESVYKAFISHCDRCYITKVFKTFPADKFLENLDKSPLWKITSKGDILEYEGIKYCHLIYERNT